MRNVQAGAQAIPTLVGLHHVGG